MSGLLARSLAQSRCSINACGIKFPTMILRDKLPGFVSGCHTPKHLRRKHVIVPGRERGSEREKGPPPPQPPVTQQQAAPRARVRIAALSWCCPEKRRRLRVGKGRAQGHGHIPLAPSQMDEDTEAQK